MNRKLGVEDLFFELIQVTIGRRKTLSHNPTEEEWGAIFSLAHKQAIIGEVFSSIEKLSEDGVKPPFTLLMEWIAIVQKIEGRNKLLNQRCVQLHELFTEAGFATCILKGQGNALMYPNPLRRQCGDIDIWVAPKLKSENGKLKIASIIDFLNSKCDMSRQSIGYHHTNFPVFNDVEVEVHWRPSWKSSPVHNVRMQRWFKEQADVQFSNIDEESGLYVPTWEFNVIYMLQHMFLHIFQEGLGLRQVMDYYYLLSNVKDKWKMEKGELKTTLRNLGLGEFAGAMMYVMQEVFLMDDKCMIAPVDERRGQFLLSEIMLSGNFGQADERNRTLFRKKGVRRSLVRLKRQYRFLKYYPVEVLCAPFQVYHVIWRKLRLWRCQ